MNAQNCITQIVWRILTTHPLSVKIGVRILYLQIRFVYIYLLLVCLAWKNKKFIVLGAARRGKIHNEIKI